MSTIAEVKVIPYFTSYILVLWKSDSELFRWCKDTWTLHEVDKCPFREIWNGSGSFYRIKNKEQGKGKQNIWVTGPNGRCCLEWENPELFGIWGLDYWTCFWSSWVLTGTGKYPCFGFWCGIAYWRACFGPLNYFNCPNP